MSPSDHGVAKGQNQKKKRQERESCINNVKLGTRDRNHRHQRPHNNQVDNGTYTRQPRINPKFQIQRGSLDNVSSNPWGDFLEEQSSLRRSRSLALGRGELFEEDEVVNTAGSRTRRSQLIPRAKLIERPSRYGVLRGVSVDNLDRGLRNDYSPPDTSSNRRRSSSTNLHQYHRHTINNDRRHQPEPRFIIGQQPDSLDSNHHNKSSINTDFRVSYEDDLPGLSLPNYYPDPNKYDTDNTDEVSTESCDNSKKYSSCDNISRWATTILHGGGNNGEEPEESIPYDENIVLSTNRPLYDSLCESHYAKPRTIRGPTPHHRGEKSDKSSKESKEERNKVSSDYFESDSNFDEIKLENANIEHKGEEIVVIIENTSKQRADTTNQTIIEIEAPPQEDYKTIVTVDPQDEEKSKHSHNYLREFLESQKGSKKPLQNFLTKKLSNLSRKTSKDSPGSLADNRFHSLPDITVSKNLRKCEKIDRKLRKCEKTAESRFIVNIGKHFDITADGNIPVDFEVKIAKVPKKKTNGSSNDQFIEAVRNLNETIHSGAEDNLVQVKPSEVIMDKEYQGKLDTMRNYWGKMITSEYEKTQPEEDEVVKEPPKIVDVHTKIDAVKKKFEPAGEEPKEEPVVNKVQIAKQLFEPKPVAEKIDKISPFIKESCHYFESNQSEGPAEDRDDNNNRAKIKKHQSNTLNHHKSVAKSKSVVPNPEFDHVRYRVLKSDLFQKKIFANCEKESQFDGLMQYLQDYSFQELLRDNNIVIIEPIRTKVPHYETTNSKSTRNITRPLITTPNPKESTKDSPDESGINLKRHFFYHPIRVNKEVNEDELPNPDTVKQVRQLFEGGVLKARSSQVLQEEEQIPSPKPDPDKDHCSATDSNSNPSNLSDFGDSHECLYEAVTEHCCDPQQYVSEDVLEKIRECGTTVTYYGGRVLKEQRSRPSLTRVIMKEIKDNERRSVECNCSTRDVYQGVKFRLVKSNSCNSRLELVGTGDEIQKNLATQNNKKKVQKQQIRHNNEKNTIRETIEIDKNRINESIKKGMDQPKIIAEERKIMTQWGDTTKEKTFNGINFSEKPSRQKIDYDYHMTESFKKKATKRDEMEFESYEVAST